MAGYNIRHMIRNEERVNVEVPYVDRSLHFEDFFLEILELWSDVVQKHREIGGMWTSLDCCVSSPMVVLQAAEHSSQLQVFANPLRAASSALFLIGQPGLVF
jgi:hypothetical protein